MLQYKYIILGTSQSYYPVGYYDITTLKSAKYLTENDIGVNSLFFSLCISPKIPALIRRFFCLFLYRKIYPNILDKQDKICLVFFGGWPCLHNTGYIKYINTHYPNIKKILFLQDIVAANKYLDIKRAQKEFDYVLSYDKSDCEKYNLIYQPTPYSNYPIKDFEQYPESDLFFCGAAKSRYKEILHVYDECTKQGIKCLFFITGTDDSIQKRDGIVYGKRLEYTEMLKYVKRTKCILEIMQERADGYTARTWESIIYDKHLLSNNSIISESPFYNHNYIHDVNTSLDKIASWINSPVTYGDDVKLSLSPIKLIEKIDSLLKTTIDYGIVHNK